MSESVAPAVFRRKDMMTVGQICKEIPGLFGGSCSRQHVYNLIERGDLKPVFRFGRRQGLFVPKDAVRRYVSGCQFDPNA